MKGESVYIVCTHQVDNTGVSHGAVACLQQEGNCAIYYQCHSIRTHLDAQRVSRAFKRYRTKKLSPTAEQRSKTCVVDDCERPSQCKCPTSQAKGTHAITHPMDNALPVKWWLEWHPMNSQNLSKHQRLFLAARLFFLLLYRM
jgi:hypothetical protein